MSASPVRHAALAATRPERRLHARLAGPAVDAAMPREHALDVAVEDRDCARRTRTRRSPPPSSGRCRAALRASPHRAGKRPPCSRITTFARPRADDARAGSSRARSTARARARAARRRGFATVGKPVDEARVVRQHRRDLRLLQHDLRTARSGTGRGVSATADRGGRARAASRVTRAAKRLHDSRVSVRRGAVSRACPASDFGYLAISSSSVRRAAALSPMSACADAMLSSASGALLLSG